MTGQIVRAAKATDRVMMNIFNGLKSAMDIPPVAGLVYGGITYLWLSILLPGGWLHG